MHTSWKQVHKLESCKVFTKRWLFGANCYSSYCWFPEQATEDSRLASGLVATHYESEVLCLYIVWSLYICIFSLSLGRSGHQGLDPVSC